MSDFQYYNDYGELERQIEDQFTPKYFEPALQLMQIPSACPESVGDHLRTSFSMFFCNSSAAMNSARIATEALMSHFQIPLLGTNGRPLTLHSRIEKLPPRFAHLKEILIAVKWLGNAGSHDGTAAERADVLDLYDILEHALGEIFDDKAERLREIVDRVNKHKGISPPKFSW